MLRSRPKPLTKDDAEALALQVLAFLLADSTQSSRFLALTGIMPDDLRNVASSRELQSATFEYILSDEGLLLSFCQEAGVDPALMGPAHHLLAGTEF
ncbi:DUF3572 domain-containing protein [Hyphomicrobium sp.]|uniref:DUF3572 domain-containing protein n=1 Tax=Hyphomicrobium sp. TaxID=82 RepID=UPI000FC398C4|nr:DUF3572 domain-containing protein [Hyphomicrobium sp.]RUP09217.1 MAG: DUF3572 family protein [Hyphomicrobium sp.]